MARSIVITSGKGGVGKTTLTANLGRALAALGERTVVLDADIGLNNLDILLGMDARIIYDLSDVLSGKCRLRQALVEDIEQRGMYILPALRGKSKQTISAQNLKLVVKQLDRTFDYVLIDCPAGIDDGFKRAINAAEEAIIVTTPHISALKDAETVRKLLKSYGMSSVYLVLNRVRGDLVLSGEMLDGKDVEKLLNTQLYGMIPEDDTLNLLSNAWVFTGVTDGYTAITALAQSIRSGVPEIIDPTKKYRGLFGGLKRKIKRRI